MKIFGSNTPRPFYGMFFVISILNFLRLLWSLFTDNDKEWEYFFTGVVMLFIGLIILGATNPEK
jgi:hypothetical protein